MWSLVHILQETRKGLFFCFIWINKSKKYACKFCKQS
jgi:hypothetical protein